MPEDPEPKWWVINNRTRRSIDTKVGGTLIEKIKAVGVLQDVVSATTTLTGFGNIQTAKCPLHNEQNGKALVVWIDDQRWKCFGQCGVGGDVIDFVQECIERNIEWRMT